MNPLNLLEELLNTAVELSDCLIELLLPRLMRRDLELALHLGAGQTE